MTDLSQFNTKEKTESGVLIQFKNPETGLNLFADKEKKKPIGIYLRGHNSKAVRKRADELNTEWTEANATSGKAKEKDADRMAYEARERLIAATTGFSNVMIDGKALTNGEDDVRAFFDDEGFEAFHVQALTEMHKSANFMKGAAKAS